MTNSKKIISNGHLLAKETLELKENLKDLTANVVFSLISDILHNKAPEPKSLDDFSAIYGSACDSIITNASKLEKLTYVSGIFTITAISNQKFNCTAELYFKSLDNKWVLKKATSENFDLAEKLLPESIQELKTAKVIKHEITAP